MFRLTALLCAAIFVTLLIAGNDYGQTRPGLERAKSEGTEIIEISRSFSPVVTVMPKAVVKEQTLSDLPPPIEMRAAPTIASVPKAEPNTELDAPIFTLSPLAERQVSETAAAISDGMDAQSEAIDREAQIEAARQARDESVIGLLEPLNPAAPAEVPPAAETSLYADPTDGGALFGDDTAAAAVDPYAAPSTASASSDGAAQDVRVVDASSVNVRLSPDGEGAVIGKLYAGEMVQVISVPDAEWVEVFLESEGLRGYVAARLLTASIY